MSRRRVRDPRVERSLFTWRSWLVVLFAFAAAVTITFALLFGGVELPYDILVSRSPLVLANVFFISALAMVVWGLWRRQTTQKPVERILSLTERVALAAEDGRARVAVADDGCGIDSAAVSRIFDKFYQADPSRATRGNGLGLALVKRVVDLHRGEISVESELGRG